MKTINNISFVAIVALAISSCAASMEDEATPEITPENPTNERIVIHAKTDQATKAIHGTDLTEGSSFRWEAGVDQLSVFKYNSEYEDWSPNGLGHRFVNTADGKVATFVPRPNESVNEEELSLSPGDKITGFYLYGNAQLTSVSVGGDYQYVLRSALGSIMQEGKDNSDHLTYGDYMFAKPQNLTSSNFDEYGNVSITMEFRHIFSKIRFLLKNSTNAPVDVYSVIYRSTCETDIMQGTLYMDLLTGEIVTPDNYEWGDVQPSNSGVLEVKDVTLAPGESTYVWMWCLPLDFSEGNAAGRKADVMVNTSAGVFRVSDIAFNQPFEAGKVYRQGMELTSAKLVPDFAYIPDPNFVKMLWNGTEEYDPELGYTVWTGRCPIYNLDFTPMESPSDDWETYQAQSEALKGGRFVKPSELTGIETLYLNAYDGNMLCLDGLQYFTGLKALRIELGMDMSSPMTLKALRFDTLAQLEELSITQSQLRGIDLSHNTKLRQLHLGGEPNMTEVKGLGSLSLLESFSVNGMAEGAVLDLSGLPALKDVNLNLDQPVSSLDLSGLSLDKLSITLKSMDGVKSDGLSAKELDHSNGQAFPSPVGGVRVLSTTISDESSIASQFSSMNQLDSIYITVNNTATLSFTPEQSSLRIARIYYGSDATSAPDGWNNLSSLKKLELQCSKMDISEMNLSASSSLVNADITAKSISSLSTPANLNELRLNLTAGISFTPTGVKELTLSSAGNVSLGGCSSLTYLSVEDKTYESNTLVLGSFPNLETLSIHMTIGSNNCFDSVTYASGYPSLKRFYVDGRNIHEIPSASVFPALEIIGITSNTNAVVNGIGSVDLRQYSNLKSFSVGTLNMNYPYTYYNNRYVDAYGRTYVRSTGAFVLSPEQWEAVKTGTLTLTGYNKVENTTDNNGNPCTRHEINSVYGVRDASDNAVEIKDEDGSDGEITRIVVSKT